MEAAYLVLERFVYLGRWTCRMRSCRLLTVVERVHDGPTVVMSTFLPRTGAQLMS